MSTLEESAEKEANKKHLTGAAKKRYIGGAYNRARRGSSSSHPKKTPNERKEAKKKEKAEASEHWKKYNRYDDTQLSLMIHRGYKALPQKQRNKFMARAKRESWSFIEFKKMNRRQKEKMVAYLEDLKKES